MNIRNLNLVQRNPGTQRIDIKSTLQLIAKELIVWSEEEKRIRTNRRYKAAIRRVFKRYGAKRIPTTTLVVTALQEMNVKPGEYNRTMSELKEHIDFNRRDGGYLRIMRGLAGGVELRNP